ncbi:MAG: hypothetical protein GXP40_03030 [Chloroflexi bacterium]|nr:hypothetical protein [Chloroflexota bacterium]
MTDVQSLHRFLQSRRSIRRFKADPVPESVVERILETATFSPSAHNLQPWRFALIQTSSAKEKLGAALTNKMRADMGSEGAPQTDIDKRVSISLRRIDEAPVTILLCRDATAVRREEPGETTMGIQSVAIAGLQLLLAAHAEGLGGNWICWPLYAQEATRAALDLPKTWLPEAMILLGYADEEPKEKTIRPLDQITIQR